MNDVKIGLPNKRDALQGPKNRESQLEKNGKVGRRAGNHVMTMSINAVFLSLEGGTS